MKEPGEEYLGDGLYASWDGYQVKLRAPRDGGDHVVFLDPHTMQNFIEYLDQTGISIRAQRCV